MTRCKHAPHSLASVSSACDERVISVFTTDDEALIRNVNVPCIQPRKGVAPQGIPDMESTHLLKPAGPSHSAPFRGEPLDFRVFGVFRGAHPAV